MTHLLQPFSAEFQADPYPTYHRLRTQAPVYCARLFGVRFWVLTRYRDVAAALRDPRLSAQAAASSLMPPVLCDGNLFFKDPPEHTRLRSLINKAFLPQTVEAMRPWLSALIEEVIDAALAIERERGHFDVVHDLGMAVSLGAMSGIMGLPRADREQLKQWTDAMSVLLDGTQILPGLKGAHQAAAKMVAYFQDAIALRRHSARGASGDFLSALIAARDEEDRLSDEELLATAIFTLMAGHETVTAAVSSGLLALCKNAGELERLRADPTLAASAFDEMLRYDPPGQLTTKTATEAMEIGGQRIEKGQAVVAVIAAANRDPEIFPEPDRFDIGRRENRHLSFSLGPHYCVGAALARMQGQLLLSALVRRMPELHIDPAAAVRKPGIVLRGLHALPARSALRPATSVPICSALPPRYAGGVAG